MMAPGGVLQYFNIMDKLVQRCVVFDVCRHHLFFFYVPSNRTVLQHFSDHGR